MKRQMMRLRGVAGSVLLLLGACQSPVFAPMPQVEHKTPAEMYSDPKVVELVEAIVARDPQRIAELAKQGANVNANPTDGVVPLLWASEVRCNACIATLLKAGADPWMKMDVTGESAVEMILERRDRSAEQLPVFLGAGLDPNHPVSKITDVSLLGIASFHGPLEIVKRLVAAGAEVNFHPGGDFQNVLDRALDGGRFDVAYYLLEHGYQPNLEELARGVQASHVDPAHEPERQRVIAWLKARGVNYPPDPTSDP